LSLTTILYPPPTAEGFEEWAYQHYLHHQAIIQAAKQVFNVLMPLENIYPINLNDMSTWLENHQNQHNSMDSLCNIPGNDLIDVDFTKKIEADAWFQVHWQEHQGVASVLGLGT
jgi:hypothetical protein